MLSLHRLLAREVRHLSGSTGAARFAVVQFVANQLSEDYLPWHLEGTMPLVVLNVWVPYVQAVLGDDPVALVAQFEAEWTGRARCLVKLLTLALGFQTYFGNMGLTNAELGQAVRSLSQRFLAPGDPVLLSASAVYGWSCLFRLDYQEGLQHLFAELRRHEPFFDPLCPLYLECCAVMAMMYAHERMALLKRTQAALDLIPKWRAVGNLRNLLECVRAATAGLSVIGNCDQACALLEAHSDVFADSNPEFLGYQRMEMVLAYQMYGDAERVKPMLAWRDKNFPRLIDVQKNFNADIASRQSALKSSHALTEICIQQLGKSFWIARHMGMNTSPRTIFDLALCVCANRAIYIYIRFIQERATCCRESCTRLKSCSKTAWTPRNTRLCPGRHTARSRVW